MKKTVYKWTSLLAAVSVILFTFVFFVLTQRMGRDTNTEITLRLAWLPGVTFIGDYVAKDKDFWKERGLDVTLNPGGFEFDAIKLVAAGADTIGVASAPQILQARANGVPVVAIGAVITRSPIGWVSKKDSGIKTPSDFVGKNIGAQFGTHTEITFEALMAKLGIPLETIRRIAVKFDPRPFVAGTVDVLPVYLIDQPIDLSLQGLELNEIDPGDYGVSLAYGNVYFTSEDTISENPELVRSFIEGATQGWLYAYENRVSALNILSRYMENPNSVALEQKLNAMFTFIEKDQDIYRGVFSMEDFKWKSTLDIMKLYGGLSTTMTIEDAFTNEFIH